MYNVNMRYSFVKRRKKIVQEIQAVLKDKRAN